MMLMIFNLGLKYIQIYIQTNRHRLEKGNIAQCRYLLNYIIIYTITALPN